MAVDKSDIQHELAGNIYLLLSLLNQISAFSQIKNAFVDVPVSIIAEDVSLIRCIIQFKTKDVNVSTICMIEVDMK